MSLQIMTMLLLVISSSIMCVYGSYEEPEEVHEECYCPKPKTVTKYVVVETPKYIPVYKTKYVTLKKGYESYEHDSEYKKWIINYVSNYVK